MKTIVDAINDKPSNSNSTEVNIGRNVRSCNETYSFRQRNKRTSNAEHNKQKNSEPYKKETIKITLNNSAGYSQEESILCGQQPTLKVKSKPAPLSKYRRKTANARERTRMREINLAFENLRKCVPNLICGEDTGGANEKLTKITTLRLAMKYINILRETLNNPTFETKFLLKCISDGDHRFSINRDFEKCDMLAINIQRNIIQYTCETGTNQTNEIAPPISKKKQFVQIKQNLQKKQQKLRIKRKVTTWKNNFTRLPADHCEPLRTPTSPIFSISSLRDSYSPKSPMSARLSPSLKDSSYQFDWNCDERINVTHSQYSAHKQTCINDLKSHVLESDGESLHRSECCISPLDHSTNNILSPIDFTDSDDLENVTSDNYLSKNAHSIEKFDNHDEPSSCISPLIILDGFSPFGDLLHEHYDELNSLDLLS